MLGNATQKKQHTCPSIAQAELPVGARSLKRSSPTRRTISLMTTVFPVHGVPVRSMRRGSGRVDGKGPGARTPLWSYESSKPLWYASSLAA